MRTLNKETWPYQVTIDYSGRDSESPPDLNAWCTTALGKRCTDWFSYHRNANQLITVAFKDEASMLVFKIIWGKYVIK